MGFATRFRLSSLLASLLVMALLGVMAELWLGEEALRQAHDRERESLALSAELRQSSDELTRLARTYVVTGDARHEKALAGARGPGRSRAACRRATRGAP